MAPGGDVTSFWCTAVGLWAWCMSWPAGYYPGLCTQWHPGRLFPACCIREWIGLKDSGCSCELEFCQPCLTTVYNQEYVINEPFVILGFNVGGVQHCLFKVTHEDVCVGWGQPHPCWCRMSEGSAFYQTPTRSAWVPSLACAWGSRPVVVGDWWFHFWAMLCSMLLDPQGLGCKCIGFSRLPWPRCHPVQWVMLWLLWWIVWSPSDRPVVAGLSVAGIDQGRLPFWQWQSPPVRLLVWVSLVFCVFLWESRAEPFYIQDRDALSDHVIRQ